MEKASRIKAEIVLEENKVLTLREAVEADSDAIKSLYFKVYGGSYTLPEVNDTEKMRWAINDPNYFWLLGEINGKLTASVIFLVDKTLRIGKTFAGVVAPEARGHNILVTMLRRGIDYIFKEADFCDSIYGIVRTFAPVGFHEDLRDLGFIDLGIFPNVRKVKRYETQTLKVCYKDLTLEGRRKKPLLIPAAFKIYEVVCSHLDLEPAEWAPLRLDTSEPHKKPDFLIESSPKVEWEYYKKRDAGELILSFFPFHYPQVKLYTQDRSTEVFLFFNEREEHGSVLGIKTEDSADMVGLFSSIGEYAESMGIKYLELILPAYNPKIQADAYRVGFLPSAYYPAMRIEKGVRLDYIVTSRSFVTLDIRELKLTADVRPYLETYCEIYTSKIKEDMRVLESRE
jgi:hypothetical protein